MRIPPWRLHGFAAVVVTFVLVGRSALAEAPRPAPPEQAGATSLAELAAEARAAKDRFVPLGAEDLARARGAARAAAGRLGRYLDAYGANGQAWKRFLLWNELQQQLSPDAVVQADKLEQVRARFRSGHAGLEMPVFRDVGLALGELLTVARREDAATAREQYSVKLEQLASALDASGEQPSGEQLEEIADAMEWLERHRQAPRLLQRLRARLRQPNLYIQVSDELIAAGSARVVDNTEPVRDVILGTRISGTGRTVGRVEIRLVPDSQRAQVETIMVGTNYAQTVGRNGPARIYSSGRTELVGRKRIMIDAEGLRAWPAESSARTRTSIRGVGSTKRGIMDCIVKKVAWRRIPQQKSASERIAARHAEQRLNVRFDAETSRLLADANRGFIERFRNPLVRYGRFPDSLRFSTTANQLRVTAVEASDAGVAAGGAPPGLSGQPSLAVRLQQSLVNNLTEELLAGRTLDQPEIERLAIQLLGELPAELRDADDRGPWSITFAGRHPLTVEIDDRTVAVTVRGQSYTSGQRRYDSMNVTARYELAQQGRGMRAVRGELEIFPPGFVPGQGRRIPLRQQTLRNLLKHRFDKILPPEIVSDGVELPGEWGRVGTLRLAQLHADDGWLVLGWQMPEQPGPGRVARHAAPSKPAATQEVR